MSGLDVALARLPYRQVWAVDFEYQAAAGERPAPLCLVARELRSGQTIRQWRGQLGVRPPFDTSSDALVVTYFAPAELGCFRALGWPAPLRVLDLYAEFRAATNGARPLPAGNGLLGALAYFGLPCMAGEAKDHMRDLILGKSSWDPTEQAAILDYCEADVLALERLLPRLLPHVLRRGRASLLAALLRGRYGAAVAAMEHAGVPVDVAFLGELRLNWGGLRTSLIDAVNPAYGIYEAGVFRIARFGDYLRRHRIPWPLTPTGLPLTDSDTLRTMSRTYPQLGGLYDLRNALGELRLNSLAVGVDGRNRTMLSPFRARTGRNQPSNSKFVFGPAKWLRGLIKPGPGRAVAYVDWRSQEIGLAAALSGDERLADAYLTGDPYLSFAIAAGLAPPDATRDTHATVRDLAKATVLGTLYGLGPLSLAMQTGLNRLAAEELLRSHRRTYARFWAWSDDVVNRALAGEEILTPLGWPLRVRGDDYNIRSLQNHPMQAGGADCLRLAACEATEAGHMVCAPVHDALLIEGDVATIADEAEAVAALMQRAATQVSGGLPIGADTKIVRFPDRYMDRRGEAMFGRVTQLLSQLRIAAE